MTKPSVFSLLSKASKHKLLQEATISQHEVILWHWVPGGNFQHGGSKHNTKKLKGKQLPFSFEESDTERSSGLKEILIEPEGIYLHTRIWTGVVVLIDNNSLAREIEADDEHFAIVGSYSSNSYRGTEAFAYMADIPEEIARKFKEQARVQ